MKMWIIKTLKTEDKSDWANDRKTFPAVSAQKKIVSSFNIHSGNSKIYRTIFFYPLWMARDDFYVCDCDIKKSSIPLKQALCDH